MLLAQGRWWRASLGKGGDQVVLGFLRDGLPEDLRDLKDLKISIPLDKWNRVVKQVRVDRKLLGGILLDFAQHKDHVSIAVASDRLFGELQRVVLDATASLVESGALTLAVLDVGAD
jgi:hypothetical protein